MATDHERRMILSKGWSSHLDRIPEGSFFVGLTEKSGGISQVFCKDKSFAGGFALARKIGKSFRFTALDDGDELLAWASIPSIRLTGQEEVSNG